MTDWNIKDDSGKLSASGVWSNGASSNYSGQRNDRQVHLDRVDGTGFRGAFDGQICPDGSTMTGKGQNDPSAPGGNADTYTWIGTKEGQPKGVTVYVWDYTGVLTSLGHASMRLNDVDKTYVSWWPEGGLRGLPYVVSKAVTHTFDQDIKVEGHPPDHTIEIPCLDEEKIKAWWADFRGGNDLYCPISFVFNSTENCAGAVEKGLIAGGAANILPNWKIFLDHPFGSTFGVRPQSILEVAEEVKSQCSESMR